MVTNLVGGGQNLPGKLYLATAQSAASAGIPAPAQIETHQLPHGVQAQAAGHHWIARKVAVEEPQVRRDIQLGDDLPFVVITPFLTNAHDPVEHEHVGHGELGITGAKEAAVTTFQQLFAAVGVLRDKGTHSVDSICSTSVM